MYWVETAVGANYVVSDFYNLIFQSIVITLNHDDQWGRPLAGCPS